jgi:hypothetical protein
LCADFAGLTTACGAAEHDCADSDARIGPRSRVCGRAAAQQGKGLDRMHSHVSESGLQPLSTDELRQITGGNAALGAGLAALFAGINAVVKVVETVIIAATGNNPGVVSTINKINSVGLAVENVAVGVATIV